MSSGRPQLHSKLEVSLKYLRLTQNKTPSLCPVSSGASSEMFLEMALRVDCRDVLLLPLDEFLTALEF